MHGMFPSKILRIILKVYEGRNSTNQPDKKKLMTMYKALLCRYDIDRLSVSRNKERR